MTYIIAEQYVAGVFKIYHSLTNCYRKICVKITFVVHFYGGIIQNIMYNNI